MPETSQSLLNRPRWLPDLLATRWGRLTAFFFLYVTEGVPLGFTATAVATQMRRQGLTPGQIGVFVGLLYAPWAWKWVVAPVVDVVYSHKLGRRRGWIVSLQILMVAGLMISMGIDYTVELKLYTAVILAVNIFGATQDVAIDALACTRLEESERGMANGLMFAGAYIGNALGGAGVLFLADWIGFANASYLAVGSILAVTLLISIPLRESRPSKIGEKALASEGRLMAISYELATYVNQLKQVFLGQHGSVGKDNAVGPTAEDSQSSIVAAALALLPFGALSLSLALGSNLAVEFGMNDTEIAQLMLVSAIISAAGCVVGGFLSDWFGRRKMLALYIMGMAIPPLVLAYYMQSQNYFMPISPTMVDRPVTPEILVTVFWSVSIGFAVFQGLMFGTRTALFMDVCDPRVAATQFTAYMSLLNVTIWYSASWQGWAIDNYGYPATLAADATFGLLSLFLLPFVIPRASHAKPEQLPAEPPYPPNV